MTSINKDGVMELLVETITKFIISPEEAKTEIVQLVNTYKDPLLSIFSETGVTFSSFTNYFADMQIALILKYKKELSITTDKAIDLVIANKNAWSSALKDFKNIK